MKHKEARHKAKQKAKALTLAQVIQKDDTKSGQTLAGERTFKRREIVAGVLTFALIYLMLMPVYAFIMNLIATTIAKDGLLPFIAIIVVTISCIIVATYFYVWGYPFIKKFVNPFANRLNEYSRKRDERKYEKMTKSK